MSEPIGFASPLRIAATPAMVVVLTAPTLLSALVVTSVFASGRSWSVGAHTAGVAVAAVLLWRRFSLVLCVVVAVLVTAGLRAI